MGSASEPQINNPRAGLKKKKILRPEAKHANTLTHHTDHRALSSPAVPRLNAAEHAIPLARSQPELIPKPPPATLDLLLPRPLYPSRAPPPRTSRLRHRRLLHIRVRCHHSCRWASRSKGGFLVKRPGEHAHARLASRLSSSSPTQRPTLTRALPGRAGRTDGTSHTRHARTAPSVGAAQEPRGAPPRAQHSRDS